MKCWVYREMGNPVLEFEQPDEMPRERQVLRDGHWQSEVRIGRRWFTNVELTTLLKCEHL